MSDYEIIFVLQDREKLVRLFALQQGWCRDWLISQQAAMESLYDRKFDLIDAVIHVVTNRTYPLDDHTCLDHAFLQAFFSSFPKIEILQRPDLTFVGAVVPPRMLDIHKYEDAWKHHAQTLVLLEPKKE